MIDRLKPFLDRGLLETVPTKFQITQGELEMWPWVISTDVTDESRYAGAPLSHPLARQPVIFAQIGWDHLRIGTGLGSKAMSAVSHLHYTFHRGMPVWDLQVLQTHPEGLDLLEQKTTELVENTTPWAKRQNRRIALLLPNASEYHRRFLGSDGWIARARAFDYPTAEQAGAPMPDSWFSVVGFMRHVISHPAHPRELGLRLPLHLAQLATSRFRQGRGFGWFAESM